MKKKKEKESLNKVNMQLDFVSYKNNHLKTNNEKKNKPNIYVYNISITTIIISSSSGSRSITISTI